VVGSTEGQGSNLDVYRIDLPTGRWTRLTTGNEWDEDADYDPRGRYLAVGSTRRNFNTMRGTNVVPLPPFLDAVKTVFFARFKLANHEERRRALEPWVTDEASERGGRYGGRQLSDLRGGWDARMPINWSHDGTRLLWTDQHAGGASRVVVARLRGLEPAEPRCERPDIDPACRTPTPAWAPPVDEYPVAATGVRALPGPRGGVAILTYGGLVAGGEVRIDYRDYRGEDGVVLNGSEVGRGLAFRDFRLDFEADVRASGAQTGRFTARAFGAGRRACGTFEGRLGARSERTVFGRTDPMCGFPRPPACANRRDDDGDGLEDLTDGGCASEEDGSEAGPPRSRSCVRRAIPGTGIRARSDGALEVAVPGWRPVDVALVRHTRRGRVVVARHRKRITPLALPAAEAPRGALAVRFRAGRAAQADLARRRRGRVRPAGSFDRVGCGLLRRASLSGLAVRGRVTLRVRTRRAARIAVQIRRGRRLVAARRLGVVRGRRGLRRQLRVPRGGRVTVRVIARRGRRSAGTTLVARLR